MTTSDRPHAIGVFVLANDKVFDWLSAFVTSYRTYNPELPLRLIPFDQRSARCEAFVREHGGEVFRDDEAFERLERFGASVETGKTPSGPHWFRRFAAFDGPFDSFAYLDCRMLVLADIAHFASAPVRYDVPLVHYDVDINQVYETGEYRTGVCRRGLGRGFLSGLWASRKGLFSIDQMAAAAEAVTRLRCQMNPRNTDQFFLNYLCDTHGINVCHIADLDGRLVHSAWAHERGSIYEDRTGVWRRWDFFGRDHGRQLLFLHWAGFHLRPSMPHFSLHRQFRRPARPRWVHVLENVVGIAGRIGWAIRGNRQINTTYHAIRAFMERTAVKAGLRKP